MRIGGDEVNDESDRGRLPIATSRGHVVPVSTVADLAEARTVVQIGRGQMRRRLLGQRNYEEGAEHVIPALGAAPA